MRRVLLFLLALCAFAPAEAEIRLGVETELYSTLLTIEGPEDWRYFQSGSAGISFRNEGSKQVRGELVLDFSQTGASALDTPEISLKKLYIRPGIGDLLFTFGKTRSTWGAGLAFNAGDLIFGSDSVDFTSGAEEPRNETAWLVNMEIPIGAFSFLELITLPGNTPDDRSAETDPADSLPTIDTASAGGRLSIEAGPLNLQTGYLYRGDEIAGLGSTGHRAFLSLEGIAPFNWHISASTTGDPADFSIENLGDNWMITGGAFNNHTIAYIMKLSWRMEFLLKPSASFAPKNSSGEDVPAGLYGLFLYPTLSLSPRENITYSLSALLSPIDLSANTAFSLDWNIYESLVLTGRFSVQAGECGDVFDLYNPGALSWSIGARYLY